MSSGDRFEHGEFWNSYSRSWEEQVGSRIGVEVLGEEWAPPERTREIFERFAAPYFDTESRVVEIGPGGGKFSRMFVERCRELILIDISSDMLRRANRTCGGRARELLVQGGDLSELKAGSVDLAFSYDVFIHLESEEVFRYFAAVNRVLRPGGTFSVHTSTFESRWGLHSFFQQLRDHRPRIGTRYGGRMYPMTGGILRRFAEHTGFTVVDCEDNWEDKDVILALRKTRPARPWTFFTTSELYQRFELSERVGGSDRRELYAARLLATEMPVVLAIGDADDPDLRALAAAPVPEHPALAVPRGWEEHAGIGIVVYDEARGNSWARLGERERATLVPRLADLFEGLLLAHRRGLVHGEIGPDFILSHVPDRSLRLVGLVAVEAAGDDSDDSRKDDLEACAGLLRDVASGHDACREIEALARELAAAPASATLERAIRLLARPADQST